jgi:hypothetical protein
VILDLNFRTLEKARPVLASPAENHQTGKITQRILNQSSRCCYVYLSAASALENLSTEEEQNHGNQNDKNHQYGHDTSTCTPTF